VNHLRGFVKITPQAVPGVLFNDTVTLTRGINKFLYRGAYITYSFTWLDHVYSDIKRLFCNLYQLTGLIRAGILPSNKVHPARITVESMLERCHINVNNIAPI
jgi:hypothetical protein